MNKILANIIFIFLLACSLDANEKVSLQLQWKHQFEFAGYYVAKELGFYDDVGFDVEFRELESSIIPYDEVANQKATFAVGRSSILIDISKGNELVLLASIFQSSPTVLLSLKSSNIHSPKDLLGKRVMISQGIEYDVEFVAAFRDQGIDFINDTVIMEHSADVNDLVKGKTDAIHAYLSNEPYTLKEKNIEYNIMNPKNYGFDFYGDILFTSKKLLLENPEKVKRFKNASLKGWDWAFDNIEKTVDIVYNKYNTQNKSKEALLFEAYELKKLAFYETNKIGTIDETKLTKILNIYKNMGLIENDINLQKVVYGLDANKLYLTEEEKGYITNKKTLKVHNETSWKPFNFFAKGVPNGYSIDLMNLLATKLGLEIEYVTGPSWSEFMSQLKKNEIDVMLNIIKTPQRSKFFNFTVPFKRYEYVMYSNIQNQIGSLEELNGKSISLVKDFAIYEYILNHYPDITIHEVDSLESALKMVSFGKSDATILLPPIANQIILDNVIYNVTPTSDIVIDKSEYKSADLAIATNKNEVVLLNLLNKALMSLSYDEITLLDNKWFGSLNHINHRLNFTQDELSYLKEKSFISMCIDPNWMPYESLKEGKHYGLSKEFIDHFEEKIGIPIKLIPTTNWLESIEYAKERKCDIWSLAMETFERKEYMNFTKSYIKSPLVIATKYDKLFIANIEDVIATENIGVVKGYAFEEIYKKRYPNHKLVSVDNIKDGLDKVQSGELYGFIDSLITIGYELQNNYIGSLKIAGKFDDTWNLSIGVRNDDLKLLNIFNKVILSTDEKLQQDIINRWVKVVFEQKVDYSNIFRWIGLFFIIVLILAYRQYILGKYNKTLKSANSKIKEINEELHYLIDTMMESILIFQDKKCIDCNNSALDLLGYHSKQDLIGKNIDEFLESDDFGIRFEDIEKNQAQPCELNILSNDKNHIPVLMKFKNFNTKSKNIKIVAIFDLREIKEQNNKLKLAYLEISKKQEELYNLNHMLETRVKDEVESNLLKDKLLQQQTRLAQMGELISMIAHQWRQPLASIASCSIGIKLKIELEKYDLNSLSGKEEFLSYLMNQLDDIEKFSQNLTQTIDDFRDFYKPNKKLNFITIENVILKALDIIEVSLINSGIKIIKEFNANIEIQMFQNEIMQVILNILKNCDDNFKERNIAYKLIKITTNITQNGVELIIWDNGGGIKEEYLDKIFDPYFSTKDESNGTGLGLYMSKVIIREHHHGKLTVKNYDNGVGFILNLNKS
ncbi:MAG: transporter substrate-binding domain-containing protein [Arcobacteraceae bacterium]|nr:transporter substrate-binding domain-containing protein [Arcobacteraceae bacterium]